VGSRSQRQQPEIIPLRYVHTKVAPAGGQGRSHRLHDLVAGQQIRGFRHIVHGRSSIFSRVSRRWTSSASCKPEQHPPIFPAMGRMERIGARRLAPTRARHQHPRDLRAGLEVTIESSQRSPDRLHPVAERWVYLIFFDPPLPPGCADCMSSPFNCDVDEWSRCDGNQIELDAPNSPTEVVASLVNCR
jgi:hypothetical protein